MIRFYKYSSVFSLLFIFVPALLSAQKKINNPQAHQLLKNKVDKTQFFIENKGQWAKQVKFLAKLGGMNAWITDSGVVYDFYNINRNYSTDSVMKMLPHNKDEFKRSHTTCKGQVINMVYKGINLKATKIGKEKRETYYNYIIGNDSSKWTSNVGLFSEAIVKDAYPGIDIRYYFDNGQIRYDYNVNPGADIFQINFGLSGENNVLINDSGELIIKTILGDVKHGKLYAYQQSGNEKREVSCRFTRNDNGNFGLITSEYDKRLQLVIDPLVWSTYLGGSNWDGISEFAREKNGNIILTGWAWSADFPTTAGAYSTLMNGVGDIIVTKMNSTASSLIFSTFIGGSEDEGGASIAINNLGEPYILGQTTSNDFPTTTGAFDRTFHDTTNLGDCFVLKLNSSGSALIYSTYIGGVQNELPYAIAIDDLGFAYIAGSTCSNDYPVTIGSYSLTNNGKEDCFISKLNPSGTALVYSTFIGGTEDDVCNDMVIDKDLNVYITGYTYSANYPTTPGTYDHTLNGYNDILISKLNSTGSDLVFSTLIGGDSFEYSYTIALDTSRNIYISGATCSPNYPTTTGVFNQNSIYLEDIFVTKLNPTASKLIASTFLGGNSFEHTFTLALDPNNNVFLSGETRSTNYPVTPDAISKVFNGGTSDIIISKLNSDLSVLMYSTYLGGVDHEEGICIFVDSNNGTYLAGYTWSSNFPTTTGVYSQTHNGIQDGFITKLFIISQAYKITFPFLSCSQMQINWIKGEGKMRVVFMKEGNGGYPIPTDSTTYTADTVFGSGSQIGSSGWYCIYNDTGRTVNISGLKLNTTYRIMVMEYNGAKGYETYFMDSSFNNPVNKISGSIPIAIYSVNAKQQYLTGNNFIFSSASTTPKANIKIYWDFGDGNTSTASNPVHSYSITGTFKVMMIAFSSSDCADTLFDSVIVLKDPPVVASFTMKNACAGDTVEFRNTSKIIPPDSFMSFNWDFGDGYQSILICNPKHIYYSAGTYIISFAVLTTQGNKDSITDTIEIYPSPTVNITAMPDTIVTTGKQITLTANGTYDQLLWWNSSTQQSVDVNTEGKYWVTASFNNGCKRSDTIELTKGENNKLVVVNVFTPNGDGFNDKFVIKNIDQIKPCKLTIFNRWGDELYSSNNYQNNWDGTYKGKTLPEGTYYYVLVPKVGKVIKGAVNILK